MVSRLSAGGKERRESRSVLEESRSRLTVGVAYIGLVSICSSSQYRVGGTYQGRQSKEGSRCAVMPVSLAESLKLKESGYSSLVNSDSRDVNDLGDALLDEEELLAMSSWGSRTDGRL